MNTTVLIVDDEPHARRYIRDLLIKDQEINVLEECKNGREALAFVKNVTPDIIFLDIEMPGVTGLEAAQALISSNSIIIFTTAYDQYALEAFETEAMDYLLKPFDEKRFYKVLNRAKDMIENNQQIDFSKKFINLYNKYRQTQSPHISEFVIKEKGLERMIKVVDIMFLEASSVYVLLHTANESVLYRSTLNLLEEQLSNNFLRIHRSFIVNMNQIASHKYLNNNTFSFVMPNGKEVISSRSYKDEIKIRLK